MIATPCPLCEREQFIGKCPHNREHNVLPKPAAPARCSYCNVYAEMAHEQWCPVRPEPAEPAHEHYDKHGERIDEPAADESAENTQTIAAQAAEIERLRAALEHIASGDPACWRECEEIAREALK
jgi:hypothetical protein